MLWSLPKGHVDQAETAEQTAVREVAEETGIRGSVLAALRRVDYSFVADGRRVDRRCTLFDALLGGGSSPRTSRSPTWHGCRSTTPVRLAYADERRLHPGRRRLIDELGGDGPAALPPSSHPATLADTFAYPAFRQTVAGRKNGHGPGP